MFYTKLPLYGIIIIFSIVSGLFVIYKNSYIIKLNKEETIGLLLYICIGSLVGAKYFTFITNFNEYRDSFNFLRIGLSSYGALIGIIIMIYLFSRQYKKSFRDLFYILLPSIPLMYGIGKIGCFLVGCCYGIKYNGPFKIIYNYSVDAPAGVSLFPIQIVESIIFIVIFMYVNRFVNKKKNNYNIMSKTLVLCGGSKFLLDFLRMSHIGKIISVNQIISLIFIFIGIYLIIRNRFIRTI